MAEQVRVLVGGEEFETPVQVLQRLRAEDIARAEALDRHMRRVMDGLAASWRKEARRPSVRLRRAWRALRGVG